MRIPLPLSPHAVLHWHVGGGNDPQWAVREGDWKLIGNAWDTSAGVPRAPGASAQPPDRFPLFLANLAEDVGEKQNRAEDRPDLVAHLKQLHDEWVAGISHPAAK